MNIPYHLLLGQRDWQPLIDTGGQDVVWDRAHHQLTLAPDLTRFPARTGEQVYTSDDRRGVAVDRFGHLYWIDEAERAIRYRPAGSNHSGELWSVNDLHNACAEPDQGLFHPMTDRLLPLPRLRGLTVTTNSYLVMGTLSPSGLLVFDLHKGGPLRWHQWPESVPFAPFDMCATPDGGLWVLDLPATGGARLWYLDQTLRVSSPPGAPRTELASEYSDGFRDISGSARTPPARSFPSAMELTLAVPLADATPVAIETLPDGSLLLLDQGPLATTARIHRLECGSALGAPIELEDALQAVFPDQPGFIGHDLAFLPDGTTEAFHGSFSGTLFVASVEGNQSFGFDLRANSSELEIEASKDYLPMRRYAGKALVSTPKDVYYDQTDLWLALTALPRPSYAPSGQLQISGQFFDGKQPQCAWHRLFLDGCIPPGDSILIESRAADDANELQRTPWRQERSLYLRHINRHPLPSDESGRTGLVDEGERPFHRPFSNKSLIHKGVGTWELLFQQTLGRYLELRLTLSGSGRSTPKIRALRVYYPRPSYPHRFLPAVYREDPISASFLERFLANFEGFYTELEARIAGVQTLFDSRTAPPEALEWLASWLGALLAENWEESRRRLFIRHAVDLYRQRGTVQGLVRAIRLATEACPDERLFDATLDYAPFGVRIVEHFASRTLASGLLQSTSTTLLPSQVSATTPWQPSQGGARLHRLWRDFLFERYAPSGGQSELLTALDKAWSQPPASIGSIRFWPLTPVDSGHAKDRDNFIEQVLGLPYPELTTADSGLYRSYLARKHGSITTLNTAYALTGASAYSGFEAIEMPPEDRLPTDGAALEDWFQFVTVDVPAAHAAHRFTVLVPVEPDQSPSDRQRILDRVRAVVERERPSHVSFDVQLYWALFRVGMARIGLDTLLGEGSRFTSLVLNAGYIGEGLLAENHPWNISTRWVSGRNSAGAGAIG